MRGSIIGMLMAAGAVARNVPNHHVAASRQHSAKETGTVLSSSTGSVAPLATPAEVRPFQCKEYPEALSSLSSVCQETPSAVKLLANVPLAIGANGLVHETSLPVKRSAPLTEQSTEDTKMKRAGSCSNPETVIEWRRMSGSQQQAYANAMGCLRNKPARSGLPNTVNRIDDLAAIHQHMSPQIHDDGQFVPWHRYFLWIFEQEIRACGYTGAMGWWDETLDAGHFAQAPMFTSQLLGSAPDGNSQCITNGVLSDLTLHIGPGTGNRNHCLARGVNEHTSSQITQNYIDLCWSYTDYDRMQECLFFGVHALGHNAIGGGVMNDVYTSPGDLTFFLHHYFVDHSWRIWENQNGARLNSVDGYTTTPCEQGQQHSGCTVDNLGYVLSSYGFYPSATVGQVINTEGGFLCYKYDY